MKRTLSSFTLAILLLATTAALTSHAQRKPAGSKPSAQKGKGKPKQDEDIGIDESDFEDIEL